LAGHDKERYVSAQLLGRGVITIRATHTSMLVVRA
jgi:hypothetical protein